MKILIDVVRTTVPVHVQIPKPIFYWDEKKLERDVVALFSTYCIFQFNSESCCWLRLLYEHHHKCQRRRICVCLTSRRINYSIIGFCACSRVWQLNKLQAPEHRKVKNYFTNCELPLFLFLFTARNTLSHISSVSWKKAAGEGDENRKKTKLWHLLKLSTAYI